MIVAARSTAAAPSTTVDVLLRVTSNAELPRLENASGNALVATSPRYEVMFHGVLFNREELLAETDAARGDDATIVLRALERWGMDAPRRVKGIYIFVFVDRTQGSATIVRDQIGVYPCFYTVQGSKILISTSLRELLSQPNVSRAISRLALAEHLSQRWPAREETYFEAIHRIPPGHQLRISRGRRSVERYWDPDPISMPARWATDDEVETFEMVLDRAVSRCLDFGRAGILLSGGFDSVSVAAWATDAASRRSQQLPIALSLGFPDPTCNEEPVQRGVAQYLGLDQEYMSFSEATKGRLVLEASLELTREWPIPMLNMWHAGFLPLVARGQERGCRVILSGAGGDEWLTVTPYLAADLLKSFDIAGFVRHVRTFQRSYSMPSLAILKSALWDFGMRPLTGAVLDKVASDWWRQIRKQRVIRNTPRWIAPDRELKKELVSRIERCLSEANPTHGFYRREIRSAIDHALASLELEEHFEVGRRMGVRMLHPYWDVDLVELLARTPPTRLSRHGKSKGLVREVLARRFPGLGFERQKKVSATDYFRGLMTREGAALWSASGGARELGRLGIVDSQQLDANFGNLFDGKNPKQLYRVWDVLRLEHWLRAQST